MPDPTARAVAQAQRSRPRRESAILREVLRALPALGIVGWRNNTGDVTVGGFGLRGSADILGLVRGTGQFVAIEVKRPGERLRPAQVAFLGLIRHCGGLALTVTSVAELYDQLHRQLHSDRREGQA